MPLSGMPLTPIAGWVVAIRPAAVALALFVAPPLALAQIGAQQAQLAAEIFSDLLQSVENQQSEAEAPRLMESEVAVQFKMAFPAEAVADTIAAPQELAILSEMNARATRLTRAYLLVGIEGDSAQSVAGQQAAAQNFIAFLPEIGRLYDFRLKVAGRMAGGVAAITGEADGAQGKAKAGVEAISQSVAACLKATLAAVGDAKIDRNWRAARSGVMMQQTPHYAALFSGAEGQALADMALAAAIRETDKAIARNLTDFALGILR